jgi:hypothetical protein
MMTEDGGFAFSPDTELEDEMYKKPPAGTVAMVQVRADKDGTLGNFRRGNHAEYGPWMSIQLEVAEGEYKGTWCSMMLNLSEKDRKFRKTFEVITGVDVSGGARVSEEEFLAKLVSGIFEAEIGPEVKKGEETGYTRCFKLVRRVRDRDAAAAADTSDTNVPAIGEDHEEDLPF